MAPRHDPERCPTCGPVINTEAYRRGVQRAREAMQKAEDEAKR